MFNRILQGVALIMLFVRPVHASVVLNEFSSNSDPEWVELYNTTADPVNIMGWKLSDEVNTTASLSGVIDGNDYFVYERSGGWLNNSGGDTITLKDAADVVKDFVEYGRSGSIVGTPAIDKSAGRVSDGGGSWVTCNSPTKGSSNTCSEPSPTATNTPTKTPTQAPQATNTPTPNATVTPLPTKKLTPTKTPTPRPKADQPLADTATAAAVLGAEATVASATATASGGLRQVLPLIIALLLVAIGFAIIAFILVWKKRGAMKV